MDAASQALLQALFLRECRSLLQYVSEADPWTTTKTHRVLELVVALAREEQAALGKIARVLLKQHALPPAPVNYPANFTTINFVALEHLLPLLIAYERKSIAELEQRLASARDEQARGLLQDYLALKQRHLKALQDTTEPGPAVAEPSLTPAHASAP